MWKINISRRANGLRRATAPRNAVQGGRFRRIVRRAVMMIASAAAIVALLAGILIWTGIADRWVRHIIVSDVDASTGGRAELGAVRIEWFSLRATLENFTLHGKEAAGAAPLFHADRIVAVVRGDGGKPVSGFEYLHRN